MNLIEKYASHSLLWMFFSLVILNFGFSIGIELSRWSLPTTGLLYVALLLIYAFIKGRKITGFDISIGIFYIALFILGVFFFGKTFDASFDGQDYHSGGVIELSRGWNPWLDKSLPFTLPDANSYVTGYPKSLWILQAGIYLLAGKLNSATATNLFIIIPAIIFSITALTRLKIKRPWAIFISLTVCLGVTFIQQYFTFMADGFSYALIILCVASTINFARDKDKGLHLLIFLCAWLFLAGIKFSNLPSFFIIGAFFALFSVRQIFTSIKLALATIALLVCGVILLWVPYGYNTTHFGSPLYPSNLIFAQRDLVLQNIPLNIREHGPHVLLFYGIFSEEQKTLDAEDPMNQARLKIPFTTSIKELLTTNNFNGRVGSGGVFFSGILLLSLFLYLYSIIRFKRVYENPMHFLLLTACLVSAFVAALINPTPNVMRTTPFMSLIPFGILLILTKSQNYDKSKIQRSFCILLALILFANMIAKMVPAIYARDAEARSQNYLLSNMRNSGKTYRVHTDYFYSSYVILDEHKVKYVKSKTLACNGPKSMWNMFMTTYCEH